MRALPMQVTALKSNPEAEGNVFRVTLQPYVELGLQNSDVKLKR